MGKVEHVLAERIREAVQSTHIRFGDVDIGVTASLGVATLAAGDGRVSLIGKADRALYESKSSGRNRVTSTPTTA